MESKGEVWLPLAGRLQLAPIICDTVPHYDRKNTFAYQTLKIKIGHINRLSVEERIITLQLTIEAFEKELLGFCFEDRIRMVGRRGRQKSYDYYPRTIDCEQGITFFGCSDGQVYAY